MGLSLIKVDFGDDTVPKSISAFHALWNDVYEKSPILGAVLILTIPMTAIYFIYTWGKMREQEKNLDKRAQKANSSRKKKR